MGALCLLIPHSFSIHMKDIKLDVVEAKQYVYYLSVFCIMAYVELFLKLTLARIEHRICKK